MTLILTWVAPDGIVMGADSALTWQAPDGKAEMTLSDAYKVVPFDRSGQLFGVAFCGMGMIGQQWTSSWLRNHVETCAVPNDPVDFADGLCKRLNGLALPCSLLAFQVAGWVRRGESGLPEDIEPRFLEVSNLDRATSRVTNRFTSIDLLPSYFIPDIRKYRSGDRSIYPMHFGSAGIPENFSSTWIAKTFVPAITTMVGAQAPQPNITSVAEFVRLLIGVVVDSLRITRQPATVNRPIETLVLFPEGRSAFSARY